MGVYFIDHNTWSTQLEDPRSDRRYQQQNQLSDFLRVARQDIAEKQRRRIGLEKELARAQTTLETLKSNPDTNAQEIEQANILVEQVRDAAHLRSDNGCFGYSCLPLEVM